MSVTLRVEGVDECVRYLEDLDIPQKLGTALDLLLPKMTRLGAGLTPVATGAMKGAWGWGRDNLEGRMYIKPGAVNPRSGALVSSYAGFVDARVGITDAVASAMPRMGAAAIEEIKWI